MTASSQCVTDEEAKMVENGFVNLVVGPDLLAPADSKWSNIRWELHVNPTLIFHQISPIDDFDNSFSATEIAFDENYSEISLQHILENEQEKIASTSIGEYAPTGKFCTVSDFFLNHCGF